MEGEMEEGRDGDKRRQQRQGSVKEMEEGGKITPLHGCTYLSKMTDTAKLRRVILLFNKVPAAVGISGKSACIPSENIWEV